MSEIVVSVLRSPAALVDRLSEPAALAREAPRLLALVLACGAIFGAAVGLQRDVLQLVYAAVKLPAVLLVPLLVAVPAVRAVAAAFGPAAHPARAAAAGLVGMARTAILAAALGPAVWLLMSAVLDYSASILLVAATLAFAGLPGLRVLAAGVAGEGRLARFAAGLGAVVLYGAVAAQTGWLLRPFVLRPHAEVVFLRELRGDVFAELARHADGGPADVVKARAAPPSADALDEETRQALQALAYVDVGEDVGKGRGAAAPAASAEELERLRAVGYSDPPAGADVVRAVGYAE